MRIKILPEIHQQITEAFQNAPIESGGILGIKNGIICSFAMDDSNFHSCSEYHPNVQRLNSIISSWAHDGIVFLGLIHSHPNGQFRLSEADKQYFAEIYHYARHVDYICCPVVVYEKGNVVIHAYAYNGRWRPADLSLQQH